jgi:hypothetical protein
MRKGGAARGKGKREREGEGTSPTHLIKRGCAPVYILTPAPAQHNPQCSPAKHNHQVTAAMDIQVGLDVLFFSTTKKCRNGDLRSHLQSHFSHPLMQSAMHISWWRCTDMKSETQKASD